VGTSAVILVGCVTALFATIPAAADEPQVESTQQIVQAMAPPGEAPPATPHDEATTELRERPRRPGLVVETTVGMLGFAGNFRHVSPPAYWVHGQVGYELTRGVMVYVDSEAAWTDTSESQQEADTLPVVLWGFGGGIRGTIHATERVAVYAQAGAGAFAADVKHDELTVLGFRNAESINPSAGARIGIEWYQMDRHLALAAACGARYAEGFARVVGTGDLPLVWDAGLSLRYTF
jgi:hypothetical protein